MNPEAGQKGEQLKSGMYQPAVKPVTWDLSTTCSPVCTALVDTGLKAGGRQDGEGALGEQEQKAARARSSSVLALEHRPDIQCTAVHMPHTGGNTTQARQTWEM